jgi:peptide/nickel transport system substrate-binding protein
LALVQEIQRDIITAPGPLWLGSRLVLTAASTRVHDMVATPFLAGIYPDAQLYQYHRTGGGTNYGKFSNSALDTKLEKQRVLYDTGQRLALVQEIQRDIITAPGPLWLGSRLVLTAASTRVHDMVATPFLSGYGDAEHVWLSQ